MANRISRYGKTQKHIFEMEQNRKNRSESKGKTSRQFRRDAAKQKEVES